MGILSPEEKNQINTEYLATKKNTALDDTNQSSLKPVTLIISKNSKKVSFNLKCQDEGFVYNNNLKNSLLNSKSESLKSEIKVDIDYSKFAGNKKIILKKVQNFIKYISNRPQIIRPEFGSDGTQNIVDIRLPGYASDLGTRLQRTREVRILPCSSFSPTLDQYGKHPDEKAANVDISALNDEDSNNWAKNNYELPKLCFIINPIEDNSFYMVKEATTSTSGIQPGLQEKYVAYDYVRPITPPQNRSIYVPFDF